MSDYRKILGNNVREQRLAARMSQEQLGLEAGIDRTYISGIERGVRNPSLDLIVRIAAQLEATPAKLLAAPGEVI